MQLTTNFSLEELTHTDTGLDNTPDDQERERLQTLALFMEKVRALNGNVPISVDSAFRSEAVNSAVGGVSNSAHRLAYACDFNVEGKTPYEVCVLLSEAQKEGKLEFDQLIQEHTWVHISRDPQLRNERLTKTDGGYESGLYA